MIVRQNFSKTKIAAVLCFFWGGIGINLMAAEPAYKMAKLKYGGGGDWYANLETSVTNLIKYCNDNLKTSINPEQAIVDAGSVEIFNYPFVHMTGHGNVIFTDQEAENLRNYLIAGGFLHVSDNYGMDKFIRPQLKKVFPELDLVELPFNHPVYHQKYDFANGLPKIHEHDNTNLYKQFKDLIGEIYTAEVHHVRPRVVILIDDEGNEIVLPKEKQIPSDFFRKGDNVRGIIESVELKGNKPQIVMSRTADKFLEKL